MVFVLTFIVGLVISWISLLIVIPIAQRMADFSLPPWPETLWKLAVVAAVVNALAVALDPVHFFLSWIVGAAAFWTLMYKWFDVDLFGAIIIVVVSWGLRILLLGFILGAVMAATM